MSRHLLAAATLMLATAPQAAWAEDSPQATDANEARVEALVGLDGAQYRGAGFLYGARIGFDHAFTGRVMLGIDAELTEVTTHDQAIDPAFNVITSDRRPDDGPMLYVGGRLTWRATRNFRLFAGAGYTRARLGIARLATPLTGPFTGNEPIVVEESYHGGIQAMGGAQFLFGRRFMIGAEYRYQDYGSFVGSGQRAQLVATLGLRF